MLQILQADGVISIEEKVFAHELQSSLKESAGKFLRKLKYFFFHAQIEKEPGWKKQLEGRDKFIHEFFDNPVYFIFRKALLKEDFIVTQSKPELQKVCLFAAILCWFANEDSRIDLSEKEFIVETLTDICELNHDIANCIVEVASSIDISELQLSQLVRSLRDATEEEERHKIFMILADMVSIDKILTTHECECIWKFENRFGTRSWKTSILRRLSADSALISIAVRKQVHFHSCYCSGLPLFPCLLLIIVDNPRSMGSHFIVQPTPSFR